MDIFIEFILELVFEGAIEISTSRKVSKWVRYPIILIIGSFYLVIIGLLIVIGFSAIKENLAGGVMLWLISVGLLAGMVYIFKKKYEEKYK